MRSWQTTVCGILALISGLAPIWAPAEVAQKIQASAIVFASCGLFAAKDHNVTGQK